MSVDALLSGEETSPAAVYLPKAERKPLEDMLLRVEVLSVDGDIVQIKLPMPLIRVAIETGMELPQVTGKSAIPQIDFEQIFGMVQAGVMGNLVECSTADGDTVRVYVE